jgi:hypothetical protein
MSFLTRAIWRHTPEDSIISDLLFTIIWGPAVILSW